MQKIHTLIAEEGSHLLRIGDRFDISSTRLIVRLLKNIHAITMDRIVIDFGATLQMYDSGMALLLLLYKNAGRLKDKIYLINCRPEIRSKLSVLSIAPLLHIN